MSGSKYLITGGGGMLALALTKALRTSGAEVVALDRAALDVTDARGVTDAMNLHSPDVVIQCAAFTRVDDAETQPDAAHAVNAQGTANVAKACAETGALLVYPSTDYVFDGSAHEPYGPDAVTNPINEYGRSKLAGEEAARSAGDYLIIRTSWLYGPGGRNFVRMVSSKLTAGEAMWVVGDQRGSPTWTTNLAARIAALIPASPASGIYHLTNAGIASWYDLAVETGRLLGRDGKITRLESTEYPAAARRPSYSVLDTSATDALIGPARPWAEALAEAIVTNAY